MTRRAPWRLCPAARGLYRLLGFQAIPPYCFNPLPGTSFMELALVDAHG